MEGWQMTQLPESTAKKLGLVIDLDTCVGCHACVISCKGWNTENYGAPLSDVDAYGADPHGTFLNRVHSYEVQPDTGGCAQTVHFPKSCLHCETRPASRFVQRAPAINAARTVSFWSTRTTASAVVFAHGPALMAPANWTNWLA
jgi:succinate dehydrogenase/fumarate reductase-like Fe-S protein